MQKNLLDLPLFIETERTTLRQYQQGDGIAFFNLLQKNKSRLVDSFPVTLSQANTKENAEFWIRKKIIEWLNQTSFCFAVTDKTNEQLIGDAIIKNIDWSVPKAEIGYFIDKSYEGTGLMKEVLRAVNIFCFKNLGTNKLFLKCLQSNTRSFGLAESCGYKQEGMMQSDFKTFEGKLVDTFYYGLTKDDHLQNNRSEAEKG